MEDVLIFLGILILIIGVVLGFALGFAFLLIIPEARGFNKFYGTDYSTIQFMFNEQTYREYHGYSVTIKEN